MKIKQWWSYWISNAIITMDAMNTQRSIEAKLIQRKAACRLFLRNLPDIQVPGRDKNRRHAAYDFALQRWVAKLVNTLYYINVFISEINYFLQSQLTKSSYNLSSFSFTIRLCPHSSVRLCERAKQSIGSIRLHLLLLAKNISKLCFSVIHSIIQQNPLSPSILCNKSLKTDSYD